MPGSSCTIAVDMGTTTAKVVALADAGERPLAHRRVTLDTRTGDDGTAEQDPVLAYEAVTMALAETVAETRRAGHRIARVGFSAAMHSLLAIGPDDRPITQAILWMDSRARDEAERLWQSPDGPAVYERTGTPVHAMTPLAKLLWLGNRLPGVLNAAARLASLKEWVWHGWFGDWVADASMAGATGLYNLRQADWDDGALSLAGIDR
jgi:gluconokinase